MLYIICLFLIKSYENYNKVRIKMCLRDKVISGIWVRGDLDVEIIR